MVNDILINYNLRKDLLHPFQKCDSFCINYCFLGGINKKKKKKLRDHLNAENVVGILISPSLYYHWSAVII